MVAAAMLLSRQVAAQTPSASVIPLGDTTDMVLGSASNLPYVSSAAGYTQQLVLNTELEGAAMITGIDLYCGSINIGRAGCSIYLANTYVPDLGDGLVPFGQHSSWWLWIRLPVCIKVGITMSSTRISSTMVWAIS